MWLLDVVGMVFFFFFSSRRRHTRSLCDWSSDVCSSDLLAAGVAAGLWSGQKSHSGSGRGAGQEGQNDSTCVVANGFTHDSTTPPLFASFRVGTAMSIGSVAASVIGG